VEAEKAMSDAPNQAKRATILNGIRRSLHRGELSGAERQTVEARLAAPPRGPAVARANLPQPEKVALFCQWAEANNATVARVAAADVPAEVTSYLARNNLPAEAAMAPGAR
jgi:L-lactate dehydrogenase complex protein LldG